jgi:putative SOS response-associated peptidase YedK
MCGRYTVTADAERLSERFGVDVPEWHERRYNCAPGQSLPVVTDDELVASEWGFVPPDAAEAAQTYINARGETVADRAAFSDAFQQRRCLVPADGFYVWRSEGEERVPYRVAFPDERLFAMAGIYTTWTESTRQTGLAEFGDGGERTGTERRHAFAVVTASAPQWLRPYHHRADVLLTPPAESAWIGGDVDVARRLLGTELPSELRITEVSQRVNDPANDDPTVLEADDSPTGDDDLTNHEL